MPSSSIARLVFQTSVKMFSKSASCSGVGVLFQILCLGRLSTGIQGGSGGISTEFWAAQCFNNSQLLRSSLHFQTENAPCSKNLRCSSKNVSSISGLTQRIPFAWKWRVTHPKPVWVYACRLFLLMPWLDRSFNARAVVAAKSIVSIVLLLYFDGRLLPARSLYRFGGHFCYSDVFAKGPQFMGFDTITSE